MKRTVYVKGIPIGTGSVTIQTMTNTLTTDVKATAAQILRCKTLGADFVRVSIPDEESAQAIKSLADLNVPLIGDIHYGHKYALTAIKNGIAKIRINPSNMSDESVREVVKACIDYSVPIRIGVNAGAAHTNDPEKLARIAIGEAKKIEDLGLTDIVLSVKCSDVLTTVKAYKILNAASDYPLHIGLTEAGTIKSGTVKSAVAIGALLLDGIGDTVRVSLSAPPEEEVIAAKSILRAVGIDKNYVQVISCPTCARTNIDVIGTAEALESATQNFSVPLKIAVMGCEINGIGESKGADFGVAGGKTESVLFEGGQVVRKIRNEDILEELLKKVKSKK